MNRVCVELLEFKGLFSFTKLGGRGGLKIALSRVCVDLVKVQGYFVKLTFTKFRGSFVKLSSTNCGLNSLKFEGFFCKIYVINCSGQSDQPIGRR